MAKLTNHVHDVRERYASMLAAKLGKSLVTKENVIFNTRYEGDPISGAVKIPVRGGMTAAQYNPETGVELASSGTKYITVTMKDYAVHELIDGFDAASVPDNLVADRLNEAGKALALTEDVEALKNLVYAASGKYLSLGGVAAAFGADDARYGKDGEVTAATPTKETIFGQILGMSEALDNAGVPNEGRFVIASPAAYSLLLQDERFVRQGDLSQEILMTGAVGEAAGAAVYKSANLGVADNGKAVYLAMSHPDYCVRIAEWKVAPNVVDLSGSGKYIGASAVEGRLVFNHCITSPEAVAIVTET